MSARVAGAALALIAAALLAVSIATPVALPAELSLFAGHPTVNGQTRGMQVAYVGFYGAQLCNTGGDGSCNSREPKRAFRFTAFAELGVTGLLGGGAVMLVLVTLRRSERRNAAARFVRIFAVTAAAGAGALIVLGPTDQGAIPIGIGMAIYGAGVVSVFLASVLAVRPPPPIKLRVANRSAQPVAAKPAPQPLDIQALFSADQLRPAGLGPEPKLRRDPRVRPEVPPGPVVPDAAFDPFAPPIAQPGGEKPLFSSAPQLRPLYDATPLQGGTGGLLPVERPVIPTRPPTPLSRAAISAVAGIPTPPPFPADRPKTLPPPNFGARSKPASAPPPLPPGPSPRTQVSLVPPMPGNEASIAALATRASVSSDGSPEAAELPSNTERVLFPTVEIPLAPPQVPVAPMPRPHAETPLAPPPPPVAPAPRPHRASKPPLQPLRDTQAPQPALRAAIPMPARPGRQPPGSTQPPPLAIHSPPRVAPLRPAIPIPALPPAIPPIPAIPAIPTAPALPAPGSRAETDPHDRAETVDQFVDQFADPAVDQATGMRAPIEVGDSTSQTNVSFGVVTAEELDAAVDAVGAPYDPPGDALGGANAEDAIQAGGRHRAMLDELGLSQAAMPGEPVEPTDKDGRAGASTDVNRVAAPAPPAIASPPPPPVLDRPLPKLPISTAPDSLPPPKDSKPQTGPSPACPQCESPMAWVEEHLRFYCKSCRMYF